jgi:hypothetical protein
MPDQNEGIILFFGQKARVACDRNCRKAWGIQNRPRVQLSDDQDDYAYLADSELGEAPVNPGTYEGGCAKPRSPDEFPQKWCVRECERQAMSAPGEWMVALTVPDFTKRVFNIPRSTHGPSTFTGLPRTSEGPDWRPRVLAWTMT